MLGSKKNLTVYLIRHGESTSNVHFNVIIESLIGFLLVQGFSFQNVRIFISSLSSLLFDYDNDSTLSELGMKQAREVGKCFVKDIEKFSTNAVFAHSRLRRAKLTASLVCGQQQFIELQDLNEANKTEHVFSSLLYKRVRNFENWLGSQENGTVVVVVGHAQYFKYMLGRTNHMQNCDILKFCPEIFNGSAGMTINWGDSELTYRSPLSYIHPIARLKNVLMGKGDIPRQICNVDGKIGTDTHAEEPTCRICQETQSEAPTMPMIRPCRCKGSLSHVHIACLNNWRATSATASYQCAVCQYSYRIERTALSAFLMSENGSRAIAVSIIVSLLLSTGLFSAYCVKPVFGFDLCEKVCEAVEWKMWWRNCSYYRLSPNHNGVRLLKDLFGVDFEHVREFILCGALTVEFIEVVLSGCIVMGVFGGIQYLYSEISKFLLTPGNHDMQHMAVLGVWILTMTSTNLARLGIWIGVAFVARELYYAVMVYSIKLGQMVGETILEPHNRFE